MVDTVSNLQVYTHVNKTLRDKINSCYVTELMVSEYYLEL